MFANRLLNLEMKGVRLRGRPRKRSFNCLQDELKLIERQQPGKISANDSQYSGKLLDSGKFFG